MSIIVVLQLCKLWRGACVSRQRGAKLNSPGADSADGAAGAAGSSQVLTLIASLYGGKRFFFKWKVHILSVFA